MQMLFLWKRAKTIN